MGRGRKPKDLPPDDPDQYTVWVKQNRRQWHPDLLPALMSWFVMQRQIQEDTLADLLGKHQQLPQNLRDGMVNRMRALIDAITTLESMLAQPWRRHEWYAACRKVQDAFTAQAAGAEPA